MILGPHALLGNNPRSIEYNVEWITDLIKYRGGKSGAQEGTRNPTVLYYLILLVTNKH